MSRSGWSGLRPLPSRCWIRWAPADYPASATPATDLTRAGLLPANAPGGALPLELPEPQEVLYLPPVPGELEQGRVELAGRAVLAGHAVIWQRQPGGARPPAGAPGAVDVVDLLPALLSGVWPEPGELRRSSVAIWPLLGGRGEEEIAEMERGVAQLAEAAVPALLGVPLELEPAERRSLAEWGGERLFDRLFHGGPPEGRTLARVARSQGLGWGIPRPPVALPPVAKRNRELAGLLAVAAELWSAAGRAEGAGAELWRAAREVESFGRDLAALAREQHLGLLPWLSGPAREVTEAWARGQKVALLEELEAEWLGGEEG